MTAIASPNLVFRGPRGPARSSL